MRQILVVLLATAGLAACVSPVYNVDRHAVPIEARSLPLDRIERAIIQAGERRGWEFESVEPGHLLATLRRRQHKAVVDVYFTQTNYRIIYNSSVALKADGGVIHQNYNRWIRNLEEDIWDALRTAER